MEDVEFISCQLSALLHAVKGARRCDDVAKLRGANKVDRRREWDALLLNIFQPVSNQRDVLLERQLNLARNLAVDDSSFVIRATEAAEEYQALCLEQRWCVLVTSASWGQSAAARNQAIQFSDDIQNRAVGRNFAEVIAYRSSKGPVTGTCDAILVIPFSGAATAMLQRMSSSDGPQKLLKSFMLVQGPNPEKLDASKEETSHQIEKTVGHSRKTTSNRSLQVPSSRVSESVKTDRNQLQNLFLYHPDGNPATQKKETTPSKDTSCDEPSGTDLLLPVLLAEYEERNASAISTSMNQMQIYQVSTVTFLFALGITDQPVFGLIVNDTFGAITMAWKTNNGLSSGTTVRVYSAAC